jgi:pimeloyl-[acyl-carrier protein] methyl ester esterase
VARFRAGAAQLGLPLMESHTPIQPLLADTAALELHCRSVGTGPDLVLLHGWGLHAGIWDPVVETLSARFRLHLYDLPGHGLSAPVEHFTRDEVCAALARSAPAQAYWLGWSLGGCWPWNSPPGIRRG